MDKKYKGIDIINKAKGVERDVLEVVLDKNGMYTKKEVDKLVKAFVNGGRK